MRFAIHRKLSLLLVVACAIFICPPSALFGNGQLEIRPPRLARRTIAKPVSHSHPEVEKEDEINPEPSEEVLTPDEVRDLMEAVKAAEGLDDNTKAEVLKQCESTLEWLQQANASMQKAATYQTEVSQASDRISDAKAKLEIPQREFTLDTASLSLADLEQQLNEAELKLTEAQQQLTEREEDVKRRGERKAELAKLLGETKERLDDSLEQLNSPPRAGESSELTTARRMGIQARVHLLERQLELYRAEVRRIDALAELFPLLRDDANREESALTKKVSLLQQHVSERRRLESERQAQEAQRQVKMMHHQELRVLAERNRELAEKRKVTADRLAQVSSDVKQIEQQLKALDAAFRKAEDRVKKAGHSATVGLMLQKQREELPDMRKCADRLRFIEKEMPAANLDRLELDEERVAMGNIEAAQKEVMSQLSDEDRLTGGVFLEDTVRDLLESRREILSKLDLDIDNYLTELSELEVCNRQLIDRSSEFRTFIGEKVLWIRSADPLGREDLTSSLAAVKHLGNPSLWLQLVRDCGLDTLRRPTMAGCVLILVCLLVLFHARLRARVKHLCTAKSYRSGVRIRPTIEAVLISAIVSAEWPLLGWFVGWRMGHLQNASELVMSVGPSLQYVSILLFLSEFVRELCRPDGVAESHFNWSAHATRIARRNTWWLAVLGAPIAGVVVLATIYQQGEYSSSIGRLAFIVGMFVLAGFTHFMMRSKDNVLRDVISRQSEGWLNHVRAVVHVIGIAVPLCLAGLAVIGFYYSAQQLAMRLQTTLGMVLVCVLVHAILSRWFIIRRRMLSMEQLRQRQQNSESESGDLDPAMLVDEMPDLTEIHGKLQLFLRHGLTVGLIFGAWLIWADVLPALRVLDGAVFWVKTVEVVEVQETAEGKFEPVKTLKDIPTTLRHGLMAVLLLVATFALAKYLPALLEISILNRLPLDRGGRHATSVIVQYVVALTGVFLAGRTLNITWSSIQWLAAGMTVGLGFGLQEIFANFVSGLILLFERPIRVGDVITLGDITGTVSNIQIRATTVTNWDRKELIVPNKELITGRLLNWTLSDKTNRIVINIGLAYKTDTLLAREIILSTVRAHENVLQDPSPNVTFEGFGDSSLSFVVRAYVATLDVRLSTVHDLHSMIHKNLTDANIEIAFPQLDLNVREIPGVQTLQTPALRAEQHPDAA